MHTKKLRLIGIAAFMGLSLVLGLVSNVFAVHDLGLFELDRDAVDPGGATLPDDWATLYAGGGNADTFTGILADIGADGGTQFQGGGSKDDLNISSWLWKPGEPLDKDDITNAYAAAYTSATDTGVTNIGDTIVYFGLDRFSVAGSAQVGFWFLQDPTFGLSNVASQGGFKFNGVHVDNDVLVQSNFTNGGIIDNITVYKWIGGALVNILTVADCMGPPASPADDVACAVVNRAPVASPWPYTPKANEGSAGTFPTSAFFEGGINITRLIPDAGCFTGFMAETRSSTPFDSRLKDFVLGEFDLCSVEVVKTGDTLSKVGDPADYTVTITNTGSITLYKDDISDSLLGDITINGVNQANANVVSNTCGVSLAAGASCTITLQRTVQASDPDPLPNTVSVTYKGKANLSGIAVADTDDHSVNLFQPAISVVKAGTELSKVGDEVTYNFQLWNNSSDDTPALTCTASDSLIGSIFSGTLPLGMTPLTGKYTVQAGDPDPLVNTVTLNCSPAGFPNPLSASDSHSTDLFQPAIELTKTGDTLSKIGDPVDYVITLENNSSADTPDLTCTVTDALVGVNEGFSVASGEDHVINVDDFIIPAGASDPFVNTASVTCSPEGFANALTDSASHSVQLFQPAIELTKTGDSLSKIGDPVDYVITLENNSSVDTPDLNCTVTDATVSVNEAFTVASGADQVINVNGFIIPAGASDPFVNTASVTCSPAGFSNVLTDSASHSVQLFQPAIVLTKTGAALSKIGDPVDYVITLENNSSSDTPDLSCTVTDATVSVNESFSVVAGADHVINVNDFAIPVGASDPFVNNASVTCSPAGFSNVLEDSTSWSTNLFQPAVEVIKTGPATAGIGETVTYHFVINNLSSADAPNLILDSVNDTVIGGLTATAAANGCSSLAFGGSCNFDANYLIQAGDPDPLVNVVTVHYHPANFPNDITDTDDHSLDLIAQEGCTPGFWQGGAGSQLWNEENDLQWTYGGTNPFVHDTLFNDFFSLVIDPRLDGLTMMDLVGTGGGSDWAVKAARDMVAAYLNESAFPGTFPATSLANLETAWYAAVAGGDTALAAFHTTVSAWNDLDALGLCPLP